MPGPEADLTAEQYLEATLGDFLPTILAECASTTPEDPIIFLAEALER